MQKTHTNSQIRARIYWSNIILLNLIAQLNKKFQALYRISKFHLVRLLSTENDEPEHQTTESSSRFEQRNKTRQKMWYV